MLSKLQVQHYKSLFDTEITLEPLTVFIGPNGSGKSNICESLSVLSSFFQAISNPQDYDMQGLFTKYTQKTGSNQSFESKFWQGQLNYLVFKASSLTIEDDPPSEEGKNITELSLGIDYPEQLIFAKASSKDYVRNKYTERVRSELIGSGVFDSEIFSALKKVEVYDFSPAALARVVGSSVTSMNRTGEGIAYALVDILHADRQGFDELEERLRQLLPNISRIVLPRGNNQSFSLELIDKYSDHHIPSSDISDGSLRIIAFLTALYQEDTPSIICFEEIENGVHPWLLHKMVELLKIVSTEGISGQPVQVLITTHSPTLLNYVDPHQVRAVEIDKEGKTQVHTLPTDSARFRKALEAYDGDLGELWFTDQFGGNPA
ncbi:Chromosome partition protein Smc [Acaryochloris thomasi RCC1774]|uniref:Chromosome partition protein Smc n=1 Tax=Acaryochloris thomasi RCC1774 TaxID=1764569 RepID=A0A2W1JKR1_9CYAN|nr:ATP-binding protein [Acaryochloris thomasi]PZD73786.1 Chromosome partition protein Smc [Acaryochloris thomasi RCC1774]